MSKTVKAAKISGALEVTCPACSKKLDSLKASDLKAGEISQIEPMTVKCDGLFCSEEVEIPRLAVKLFEKEAPTT